MRARLALLSVLALPIVGCVTLGMDFGSSWGGGSHGSTRATKDGTFASDVIYVRHNERIELLLLVEGSASGSVSGAPSGVIQTANGRAVEWACSKRRGRLHELTIDGRSFPLDAGRVFHVDVRGERVAVQQIALDPHDLTTGDGSIRQNVREHAAKHPILAGFFARSEPAE